MAPESAPQNQAQPGGVGSNEREYFMDATKLSASLRESFEQGRNMSVVLRKTNAALGRKEVLKPAEDQGENEIFLNLIKLFSSDEFSNINVNIDEFCGKIADRINFGLLTEDQFSAILNNSFLLVKRAALLSKRSNVLFEDMNNKQIVEYYRDSMSEKYEKSKIGEVKVGADFVDCHEGFVLWDDALNRFVKINDDPVEALKEAMDMKFVRFWMDTMKKHKDYIGALSKNERQEIVNQISKTIKFNVNNEFGIMLSNTFGSDVLTSH